MKISDNERKCLKELAEAFECPEQSVLFYSHITNYTGLTLPQARRAVRSLKRKGLAEHTVCWDCDEGTVMGSGYMATDAGFKLIKAQ